MAITTSSSISVKPFRFIPLNGDDLVFHGAMDNQAILPFGTVEEVRQEVLDNYRTLGAGGGYILCPCHNIQPVTPVENIIAMYETGYAEGWR